MPDALLGTSTLAALLPPSIAWDATMQAAAGAITPELRRMDVPAGVAGGAGEIDLVRIYSRIDALPEDALDLLGWQFHVDFWRPTAPMAVKRQLVKESIATHRTKGTPESIAAMCALVLGVRPEVRERRYFVAGASRAGDSLCDTGRRGFLAGISLAGVDQCGPPKRPIFVYSLVVGVDEIAPRASDPQAPTRAELGLVAQVMQPARSHHRVRCTPWLAGVAWAGVDVL